MPGNERLPGGALTKSSSSMNPVSIRELLICGADLYFAPFVGNVRGQIAVLYNDLALVNENNLVRILKIGKWRIEL